MEKNTIINLVKIKVKKGEILLMKKNVRIQEMNITDSVCDFPETCTVIFWYFVLWYFVSKAKHHKTDNIFFFSLGH